MLPMDVGVMEILIHKEGMVATETHTEDVVTGVGGV